PVVQNWRMFMCCLHKTNSSAWRQSAIKFTSYMMNGAVINGSGSYDWGAGDVGKTFKNSAFVATDMLVWETDATQSSYFNDGASNPTEGFSRRHANGAVIGLFGGHVAYVKYTKYFQLANSPYKNDLWCYPNSPNGH